MVTTFFLAELNPIASSLLTSLYKRTNSSKPWSRQTDFVDQLEPYLCVQQSSKHAKANLDTQPSAPAREPSSQYELSQSAGQPSWSIQTEEDALAALKADAQPRKHVRRAASKAVTDQVQVIVGAAEPEAKVIHDDGKRLWEFVDIKDVRQPVFQRNKPGQSQEVPEKYRLARNEIALGDDVRKLTARYK